ncbi:MAG: SAM-dependent methyltransferase [Nocardiopsaceae bacterium]|nr:SAM-dependent methyltransferase [Nocardiopsaceae bacterium]
MYDYWLGGRENFQSDRSAAEYILNLSPETEHVARDNRAFLHRAVRFLAGQGVTQFLDIGSGMPGTPSVLDVAREVNPEARVVYVDYDPIVVSHGNALLTKSPRAAVVQGDLRQPEDVLGHPAIRAHLDFGKPVAVLLLAVLHFVSDDDDPARIIATIRDALAPGSYLVVGHLTHDELSEAGISRAIAAFAKTSSPLYPRTTSQIRRLFDGFDLIDPGLVPEPEWRPDADGPPPASKKTVFLGGVARRA